MLTTITTTEDYFLIYKDSDLWSVLAVPIGTSVDVDDSMSYVEHSTIAEITAWMTANSITTLNSMALHSLADQNSQEREDLRVAISMPTADEDMEETEGGE